MNNPPVSTQFEQVFGDLRIHEEAIRVPTKLNKVQRERVLQEVIKKAIEASKVTSQEDGYPSTQPMPRQS